MGARGRPRNAEQEQREDADSTDKGKPTERRGRKGPGLPPLSGHGGRPAEGTTTLPFRISQLAAALNATPLTRGLAIAAVALVLGGAAALAAEGGDQPAAVSADVAAEASDDSASAQAEAPPAARPRVASLAAEADDGTVGSATAADKPQLLIVSHEANADVFEERVEFRGIAEPGSIVSSGSAVASIGPFGHWAIELALEPGANLKTFDVLDPHGKRTRESIIVYYHPAPGTVASSAESQSGTKSNPEAGHKETLKTKPIADGQPVHSTKVESPPAGKPHAPIGEGTKAGLKAGEFSAHQKYGFCGEDPPYDVFSGSVAAGALISINSPYGSATTVADEHGQWWVTVYFPTAPTGTTFAVQATDGSNIRTFSFVHKL